MGSPNKKNNNSSNNTNKNTTSPVKQTQVSSVAN